MLFTFPKKPVMLRVWKVFPSIKVNCRFQAIVKILNYEVNEALPCRQQQELYSRVGWWLQNQYSRKFNISLIQQLSNFIV